VVAGVLPGGLKLPLYDDRVRDLRHPPGVWLCSEGGEAEAELGFPGRDFFAAAFRRAAPPSPGT